jgi:preprotein translocase subunit YajC
MPLLLIVLLFVVMYFMMIRPQQKRRRDAQNMQSALGPGDEIVTIGGLHGTVVSMDDDVVTIQIADGVNARFARPAIARIVRRDEAAVDDNDDEPDEAPAEETVTSPVVEAKKTKD